LRTEGKYKEAVALLETVMRLMGEQASAVATQNLGDLYGRLGYYAKAEPLLMKAIDKAREGEGSEVTGLRRLAQIDYYRQRYAHALPLLEQALTLSGKSNNPETRAAILEEIANVKRETRQFNEAAKLYNEALILRERETPDHPALAQLLDNMALLSMRQNQLAEAEPRLLRAQRVYEMSIDPPNALAGLCLSHLGTLYMSKQRWQEAEAVFKDSLSRLEQSMGNDAPALAPVLKEYARMQRLRGHTGEAGELEARARKVAHSAEAETVSSVKK